METLLLLFPSEEPASLSAFLHLSVWLCCVCGSSPALALMRVPLSLWNTHTHTQRHRALLWQLSDWRVEEAEAHRSTTFTSLTEYVTAYDPGSPPKKEHAENLAAIPALSWLCVCVCVPVHAFVHARMFIACYVIPCSPPSPLCHYEFSA